MYIKQNIYCIFPREQKKKKKKKKRPTYPHLQTPGRQLQANYFLRMAPVCKLTSGFFVLFFFVLFRFGFFFIGSGVVDRARPSRKKVVSSVNRFALNSDVNHCGNVIWVP